MAVRIQHGGLGLGIRCDHIMNVVCAARRLSTANTQA
jgi:hypothetical protein